MDKNIEILPSEEIEDLAVSFIGCVKFAIFMTRESLMTIEDAKKLLLKYLKDPECCIDLCDINGSRKDLARAIAQRIIEWKFEIPLSEIEENIRWMALDVLDRYVLGIPEEDKKESKTRELPLAEEKVAEFHDSCGAITHE